MSFTTILGLGQTALELGLMSSLTVLALFLSYTMLNVCDLSTDGCFTLGAAVGAVVALAGHPFLSIPAAMLAGVISGFVTAFLQTRMGVNSLFLFALVTIMCAGVGALLEQVFAIPHWLGSLLFAALVLACALAGLQSVVSAFSVSVPLLVLATLAFGAAAVVRNGGLPALSAAETGGNALLGGWFPSAVNYACYNILSTIAILGPFGAHIRKRSTVYAGLALGSGMLLVIALSVMTCLAVWPAAQSHELPMLAAAAGLGAVPMYVYALLLFAGMFGSALSNAVAFVNYCCVKLVPLRARKAAFTVLTVLLAYLASLFGFGSLIGTLYPLFGYASAVFLVLMLLHAVLLFRRKTP